MSEVRFEHAGGTRRLIGWWAATIGACLMAVGVAGALALPLAVRDASEGSAYFAIGVTAATIGFVAFIVGRNLLLRRIVSLSAHDRDGDPLNTTDPHEHDDVRN